MSHTCPDCGKICKDSKGLSVHRSKCGSSQPPKDFKCEWCNSSFKTKYNLTCHFNICKSLKTFKDKEEEQKKVELQQKETQLKEKEHLLTYQSEIQTVSRQYEDRIKELEHSLQVINEIYHIEYEKIKESLRIEKETNAHHIKQIEEEQQRLYNEKESYRMQLQASERLIEELRSELKTAERERKEINQKMISFAEKATTSPPSTTIINHNNYSTVQNIQLLHFKPSIIVGYIKPPDVIIRSVSQLINHIMRLGFSNVYRISDRARKSILWYDEHGKEIKDTNCSIMAKEVIKILRPELERQQAYLLQQLEYCQAQTDRDIEQIVQLQQDIFFTKCLCDEESSTLKKLQHEIALRAKDKHDATIDKPLKPTFMTWSHKLHQVLFPNVSEWISLDPLAFGRWLRSKLSDSFKTEGASTQEDNPFILVEDDQRSLRFVHSPDLIQHFYHAIDQVTSREVLSILMTLSSPSSIVSKIQTEEIEEIAKEVMKGLVMRN